MRISIFGILVFAILLSFPGLHRPFSTRGEPREAIVAQDMIRTGNYVLPFGYGEDLPSKPPLLHWCMVGVSRVTGELGEFEARFPSAFASVLFAVSFFFFLSPRIGESRAGIASAILLTSFEWTRAASASRVDLILSAALAGGLLGLYRWYEEEWRGVPVIAFCCLVLATLAKGPVGIVLPVGILGLWAMVTRSLSVHAAVKIALLASAVFLGALSWYGAAYISGGEKFIEMIYDENVRRFAGTMERAPHAHGVWYHPIMLIVGMLPWSLPLLFGLRRARASLLTELRTWMPQKQSFDTFSVLVGLSFLTFFSFPESKRAVYLLPAYPFFAVVLSRFVEDADLRVDRTFRVVAWIILALGAAAVMVVLLPMEPMLRALSVKETTIGFYHSIRELFLATTLLTKGLFLLPLICAIAWHRLRHRFSKGWIQVVAVSVFVVSILNSTIVTWSAHLLSGQWFAEEVRSSLPSEERLYSYGDEFYDLSFYLQRRIFRIIDSVEDNALVFVAEDTLQDLVAIEPGITAHELSRSRYSVTKPGQHVLLVRILKGRSR